MKAKNETAPWQHVVNVLTLPMPHELVLTPDAEARARIARFTGLSRLDRLEARLTLVSGPRDVVEISGRMIAQIWPVCTVSLEPFEDKAETDIAIKYASAETVMHMEKRALADEIEDFEPPDILMGNEIDLGALVVEFLLLALDPYPKKPGIAFGSEKLENEKISPFAALQALVKPKNEV